MEELKKLLASPDLNAVMAKIQASPELAKSVLEMYRKKDLGQVSTKVAAALDTMTKLGFTAASLGQIASSNAALRNLQPPGLPAVPGLNPQLTEALYQAHRGTQDVNQVLNPARQEIQGGYQSALNQAQQLSGGQAGAYQGLANLANIERMKAAASLAPVAQQVKMQNAGLESQLLGQRLGEQQHQFENRYFNAQLGQDQYNKQMEAYGNLGLMGRQNLYNSLGNLSQSLSNAVPAYLPFSDAHKEYMKQVAAMNAGMIGRQSRLPAPGTPQYPDNLYYD